MVFEELPEVLAQAKTRAYQPAKCGYDLCRAVLTSVRDHRANRPDLVRTFGTHLLQHHASSLAHDVWAMYEQVFVALLQYAPAKGALADDVDKEEMRLAQQYVATLATQFPDSLRVKRLEGMLWEATGEHKEAMEVYDGILKEDEHHLGAIKRQIAVCRARGRPAEAVKRLNEYLTTFSSDHEAWLMLHELYLGAQQYKRASFCVEELVLINPMSYLYHLRAGEITYTQGISERGGSHDQLLTARKYFAHALELKPGCLRALYGILLICAALGTSTKGKGTKVDTADLVAFVQAQLLKAYTPSGKEHPMRPIVTAMAKKLIAETPAS